MENAVNLAPAFAFAGAALAAGLGAVGSSLGCGRAGEATTVVTAEKPELKGAMIVFQAMPGSQFIYGFVFAMMVLFMVDFTTLTVVAGWQILFAGAAVGLAGWISGMYQGRVLAAGTQAVAKDKAQFTNVMIFAAIVEGFAVFGLVVGILMFLKATGTI